MLYYGLAKVDVPKELDTILKKWLKINPSDYVLISSNNKPLSSSQITKMLNKIFGKDVSVNMLRHIYLTNYYKGMPKLSNMEELASSMGHNVQTALENFSCAVGGSRSVMLRWLTGPIIFCIVNRTVSKMPSFAIWPKEQIC